MILVGLVAWTIRGGVVGEASLSASLTGSKRTSSFPSSRYSSASICSTVAVSLTLFPSAILLGTTFRQELSPGKKTGLATQVCESEVVEFDPEVLDGSPPSVTTGTTAEGLSDAYS